MQQAATKYQASATFGLLFGATVWGIIWYPYRLLDEAGLPGAAASAFTYACALLLGFALLVALHRTPPRIGGAFVVLALAAGWTNLAYVLAVIGGEVMRVLLLFYLAPLWTLLFAHLILHERAGRRGLAVIALSVGGAFVMLWQPEHGFPLPRNQAEWLGVSAGMAFALSNVLTRRFTHLTLQEKSLAVWSGATLLALLYLALDSGQWPIFAAISGDDWWLVAGIGVILVLTTLLVQHGLTYTLATRAAVIFLFELVVAAVTAYLLAAETLSMREWVGGAMIIIATLFAPKH